MTTDIIAAAVLLIGAAFILAAAVGVVRLPDLFTRMHAITKAGTMGVGSVMLAVTFSFGDISTAARALAVVLFVALTAPVAAHMIGRAAYLSDVELWSGTFVDHLHEHRSAAQEREEAPPPEMHDSDEMDAEG